LLYILQTLKSNRLLGFRRRSTQLFLSIIGLLIERTFGCKPLRHNSAIHVLGSGDPISIALYTYCGADTFDRLDWSEMVFERNELRIVNLSQLELLRCDCKACARPRLLHPIPVMISETYRKKRLRAMCSETVPSKFSNSTRNQRSNKSWTHSQETN